MQASVNREQIAPILAWHTSGGSPVSLVRLAISEDLKTLVVESNTETVWRKSTIPVQDATAAGSMFVNPERMVTQVNTFRRGDVVKIHRSKDTLVTEVGRSSATCQIVPTPSAIWGPGDDRQEVATFDAVQFHRNLKAAAAGVAKPGMKTNESLKGVRINMSSDENTVTLIGTDAYIYVETEMDALVSEDRNFLIPPDSILPALKVLGASLTAWESNGMLGLSDGFNEVLFRGIEADPKNLSGLRAKIEKMTSGVIVQVEDVLEAITAAKSGHLNLIDMTAGVSTVTVANRTSDNSSFGATESEIDATLHHGMEQSRITLASNSATTLLRTIAGLTKSDTIDLRWDPTRGKMFAVRNPDEERCAAIMTAMELEKVE